MGSPLPLSSLRLLVPPLRLMSAFMWQVVQQQKLEHYNKLEEYILLLTNMFPEILSDRQKTALVMGLRAKTMLEMCRGEVPVDLEIIKARLHAVESKATGSEVENVQCRFLNLLLSLLEDPMKKEHFFQEVYPIDYGSEFDKALQVLVGHFLSRLEQLLPVPNFKQAASWLSTEPTVWENLLQTDWNPRYLLPLLQSDNQGTLQINELPSEVEDRVISTLSLPPLTGLVIHTESNPDDQAEPSLCFENSSERHLNSNQDLIQTVNQESEIDATVLEIFTLDQIEAHNEIEAVTEPESTTCIIHEDVYLTDNDIEGLVCEIGEGATKTEMECEDKATEVEVPAEVLEPEGEVPTEVHEPESEVSVSAEVGEPEGEVSAEVDEPEPSSVISGTNSDKRNVSEGEKAAEEAAEFGADEETESKPGHLLKVVVPRHMVPVIKQVSLPEVSLMRCASNESGVLKVDPDVFKRYAASSSRYRTKTRARKSQRKRYICSECGMTFRIQLELRAHIQKHGQEAPFKCQPCKLNFKTHFQATVHQRRWHNQVTYSCPHCKKSFTSMKAWLSHRKEHKGQTAHRCTDCGQVCRSLQALVNHSKIHNHLVCERLADAYKCLACGEMFSKEPDFLSHMSTHKPKVRVGDQETVEKTKRLPGECRFCGQIFNLIELRGHLKTHPEFRPHQCDHCGKCFASLHGLLAHISNHTGEKPHHCSDCDKKFFSKSQLKSHMKSHSEEKPYCCSYCGKCFLSLGNLTIHTRLHTGEKPYVCTECGKAFSSAGCLQVHLRCHTGEKPYPCNICGKRFIVSSHRVIHMRTHTGHRPYTCEICGKAFIRKRCLDEHVYSHADTKPFPCSICSKSFTRRNHLKRHMLSHGQEQSSENV